MKARGWRLVASEMRIFHERAGIAGTMDALFYEVGVLPCRQPQSLVGVSQLILFGEFAIVI